ncbi:TlpA family protein disulfide reductase [Tautonia rosea]|uniref:TlpA family protein disulfide reductase n=1 Tax=Tautonia rosea TaxID=2728037 RepID=UPI0014763208|nr:TlpA disulfide reductase family protein [Tautonia rosea]
MRYRLLAMVLVSVFTLGVTALAPARADEEVKAKAEAVKANPTAELINEYMGAAIGEILSAMENDAKAAEKALAELKAVVDSLKPEADDAKQLVDRAKQVVPILEQRIELSRTTLADVQKKLQENVNDAETLNLYREKLVMELSSKAYSAPAEANDQLTKARAFLTEAAAAATNKQGYAQTMQVLDQIGGAIESNLAREQMIGKDAAPLSVETWVNGEPLTDSDLKGKVVLLDFWAVWCGPCIATFPHLIEWNEQYGDKGLVIIGLTNYYEFDWDEASGRAVPKPGTTPEQEQAMLKKFAASYNLTHRFAIQDGDAMSEYYQVSGIPQVVVIDQEGKVRMVRVGSGEQNAKDIGGLIAELLGSVDAAGDE